MARTPHDTVAAFLRKASIPKLLKAEAWDAFRAATTANDLAARLRRLPIAQTIKADLWDLKARSLATKESRMFPRESKYGLGGKVLPAKPSAVEPAATGAVSAFIADHFRHFNAATLHDAAEAYVAHLAKGGQMLVSLAGAMSTAELGRSLAPMIRAGKVHAISCTGANLEEDLFNLVAHDAYERMPDYHELTADDDAALAKRNINRVTDTGIPEQVAMTPIEQAFTRILDRARRDGDRLFPHEILYTILRDKTLETQYQGDPKHSWLLAAADQDLPIVVPGWADSTLGNVFAAECLAGTYESTLIRGSIDYMVDLATWYQNTSADHDLGFFQIGGGIAGDFAICVVPLLEQDAERPDTKKWRFFAQVTDADETMGGYSGALPNEKASWGKLDPDTPMFNIKGDASIIVPLIFSYVLGW
jgi:deoxyhypusine synthase